MSERKRLRPTKFALQRDAFLLRLSKECMEHPEILPIWCDVIVLFRTHERNGEAFDTTIDLLLQRIQTYSPALTAMLERSLADWVIGVLLFCTTGDESYLASLDRVERLSPDNPWTINADGSLSGLGHPKSDRHWQELRNYDRALQDAQPVGRPKKQPTEPPTPRAQRESELALEARVVQMKDDRCGWKEIAKEVCPDLNLSDPKQNRKARDRVARLAFNGRRHARKRLEHQKTSAV